MQVYQFTIVDPRDDEQETPVTVYDLKNDEAIALLINGQMINISKQQVSEFGMLLLTLAGDNIDFDSHVELLDGYGNNLCQRGKTVAQIVVNKMVESTAE